MDVQYSTGLKSEWSNTQGLRNVMSDSVWEVYGSVALNEQDNLFFALRFSMVQKHTVEFNQLAMANSEGSAVMLNRVMTKDNIGLAVLLELKEELMELSCEYLHSSNLFSYCDIIFMTIKHLPALSVFNVKHCY